MEKSLKFSTAVRGVPGRDDRGSRDGGFFLGLPWGAIPVNPASPAPVRPPSFRFSGQNSNRYDRSSDFRVRRQNSTVANPPYDSNFDPNVNPNSYSNFDSDFNADYY